MAIGLMGALLWTRFMKDPWMPEGIRPIYPRPQLRRRDWTSLDGDWDFALDPDALWRYPTDVTWGRTIRVPFAPETVASGVGEAGFYRACWYRRTLPVVPRKSPNDRVLLHFGAVDYAATVWANGFEVAAHEGGYTPFVADLTGHAAGTEIEVVVRAEDDPHDLAKPRGKAIVACRPSNSGCF